MTTPNEQKKNEEIAERLAMNCYHYPPQDSELGRQSAIRLIKEALDAKDAIIAEKEKDIEHLRKLNGEPCLDHHYDLKEKISQLEKELADANAILSKNQDYQHEIAKLKTEVDSKMIEAWKRHPSHACVSKPQMRQMLEDAKKEACDHLDQPYRKLLAERDELRRKYEKLEKSTSKYSYDHRKKLEQKCKRMGEALNEIAKTAREVLKEGE